MKIVVNTRRKNIIKDYVKMGACAFIFGLKDFSTSGGNGLTISEIKEIIEANKDTDIFINIDKMIFNNELDTLQDNLIELSKLGIKAVLFYDVAILEIVQQLSLKLDLVWANTHMVTNYNTCNYFHKMGVKYALISSEITLEEILDIKNKSSIIPMINVLSRPVVSHSKRKLLTNFYNYNNEDYDNKTHIIKNQDKEYLIRENATGTTILYGNILNGSIVIKELLDNDFPYIVLNDDEIEEALFKELISLFKELVDNYNENTLAKIEKLIGNDTVFFFKKTIYKVK